MRENKTSVTGLIAAILGGLFLTLPATAQTYKWTDSEGKIHYSDQPPPANVKDDAITKSGKNSSSPSTVVAPVGKDAPAAAKAKSPQELEADFRKRQVETAEKDAADKKAADEVLEKKKNCENAKAQVANLQAGGRITRNNAKGEREFMSDQEITQEIERGKKAAADWCK